MPFQDRRTRSSSLPPNLRVPVQTTRPDPKKPGPSGTTAKLSVSKIRTPQSQDLGVMQRLIDGGINNNLLEVMASLPDYQPEVLLKRLDTSVMRKVIAKKVTSRAYKLRTLLSLTLQTSSTGMLSVSVSDVRFLSLSTEESENLLEGYHATQADSARSLSATTAISSAISSDSGARVQGQRLVSARPSANAITSGHGPGCFCRHCFTMPSTSHKGSSSKNKPGPYHLPRLPAVAGANDPNLPGWLASDQHRKYDATTTNTRTTARTKSAENAETQRDESPGDLVSQSALETQLPLPEQLGIHEVQFIMRILSKLSLFHELVGC